MSISMKHDSHKSRFQISLGLLCLKLEQNDASKNFLALHADFFKTGRNSCFGKSDWCRKYGLMLIDVNTAICYCLIAIAYLFQYFSEWSFVNWKKEIISS